MRILLSNDDGYFSPGIEWLARTLSEVADITVVAPERDRSGASNSLTLDRPLSLKRTANGFYHVNGTPTDCVHLAVSGMLDELPDMVVSGINLGANMGDDTIYSGTVAAATEGYLLGVPSIAVSLCSKAGAHFETAARVALEVVQMVRQQAIREPLLLNVNVPEGSTVQVAIERSGILDRSPDLNLKKQKTGIFGKIAKLTAPLEEGDRVEIYRPITVDPKTVTQRKIALLDEDEDDD